MTDEQKKFIVDNWDTMSVESLRKLFNKKYNTDYKVTAFHYHTNKLGLKKFNSMHKYTKEEDTFLKDNSPILSRQELTDAFNARFGLNIDISAITVRSLKLGANASTTGQFEKGGCPWDKCKGGRDEYMKKYSAVPGRNRFEKGHTPVNIRKVGSKRVDATTGKILVKQSDGSWKSISLLTWEKYNGAVPKGYHLLSVNGDVNDTDIKNLRIVTNATQILLMSNNWHKSGAEIFDAGVAYARLYFTLRDNLNLSRTELLNKMKGVLF